ncbi:Reticulon-like protein B8 [Linum perenne]
MHEKSTAEDILTNLVENFADNIPKQKPGSFFEEDNRTAFQFNKLFGREKPIHNILGGGKSADVLLWRNKKISASVLASATAVWVLFEWLNYHFLTLVCLFLVLGMLAQFMWRNVSGLLNKSPTKVPRLVLPEELFANIGKSIGAEVNRGLYMLQNVSCGGNLKNFLVAIASLWAISVIGSWFNFITVLYIALIFMFYDIGFVAAHALPVLYERYQDQVDDFVCKVFEQLQGHYQKLDTSLLSKIPKGRGKKDE